VGRGEHHESGGVRKLSDSEWFEVKRFPHGVTMIREPYHREDVKVYLIEGSEDVAVLDTGTGAGDIAGLVASLSSRRPRVLQTHADWDHIGASHRFADVVVHPAEADALRRGWPAERYADAFSDKAVDRRYLPLDFDPSHGIPGREPSGFLEDGDTVDLGGRVLEVFHTPGHSPGSLTYLDRQARALFVGDLLYLGRMLLFFPGGDVAAFHDSLQVAAELAHDVDTVYPAHDETPIQPQDILEIRDAFETVWAGRDPDQRGSAYGYPVLIHDFGRFSFLLPRTE
jgi:glyoxylase-like metal-dependent hydrolase (beta-lactamase superfamily II)